jgi:flavorubredoxin
MKVLIVCDSEYGNTWKLATEMAAALGPYAEEVTTVKASEAAGLKLLGYDLLLVGGPTQGHTVSPRLKAVLDAVPRDGLRGARALAFDTRMHMLKLLTGSAAEGIARRLKALGADLLMPPESFIVAGTEGPLEAGEIDRAVYWVHSPKVLEALRAPVAVP